MINRDIYTRIGGNEEEIKFFKNGHKWLQEIGLYESEDY